MKAITHYRGTPIVEVIQQRDALLEIVEQWEAWREIGDAAAEQPSKIDCDFEIARANRVQS